MMMNGIKDQLNASDDEWKVLEPMVAKVMDSGKPTRTHDLWDLVGGHGGMVLMEVGRTWR